MPKIGATCLTCYGVGETVTEEGPQACADCYGEGKALSRGSKLEWRLRDIERIYRDSGRENGTDVLWLVNELRRSREALVRILARCQDEDGLDSAVIDVKYAANEALGLYEPT